MYLSHWRQAGFRRDAPQACSRWKRCGTNNDLDRKPEAGRWKLWQFRFVKIAKSLTEFGSVLKCRQGSTDSSAREKTFLGHWLKCTNMRDWAALLFHAPATTLQLESATVTQCASGRLTGHQQIQSGSSAWMRWQLLPMCERCAGAERSRSQTVHHRFDGWTPDPFSCDAWNDHTLADI